MTDAVQFSVGGGAEKLRLVHREASMSRAPGPQRLHGSVVGEREGEGVSAPGQQHLQSCEQWYNRRRNRQCNRNRAD